MSTNNIGAHRILNTRSHSILKRVVTSLKSLRVCIYLSTGMLKLIHFEADSVATAIQAMRARHLRVPGTALPPILSDETTDAIKCNNNHNMGQCENWSDLFCRPVKHDIPIAYIKSL